MKVLAGHPKWHTRSNITSVGYPIQRSPNKRNKNLVDALIKKILCHEKSLIYQFSRSPFLLDTNPGNPSVLSDVDLDSGGNVQAANVSGLPV